MNTKSGMRKGILVLCLGVMCALTARGQTSPQHVVLVLFDGARYSETLGDTSGRYTPRMKQLSGEGSVVDTMLNDGTTVTRFALPAIWSGSWATPVDTIYGGFSTQYAAAPTIWEYLRKQHSLDSTKALYVMKHLSTPWLQSFHADYGPSYWPWYVLQGGTDTDVWENARTLLTAHHPVFSLVYLADVDHSGHSGDWEAYTKAITVADSLVGELWDFLQSDPVFRGNTTMLVTNDHGRHEDGVGSGFAGHGDGCSGCRSVMFLAVGPDIRQGYRSTTPRSLTDIAPTVGALLGFDVPYATGSPMTDLISPTVGNVAPITVPLSPRLVQNYPNPFNPTTVIGFQLSDKRNVRLSIHDVLGKEVVILREGTMPAGSYSVTWEAAAMTSGMYFSRLTTTGEGGEMRAETKKMLLVR